MLGLSALFLRLSGRDRAKLHPRRHVERLGLCAHGGRGLVDEVQGLAGRRERTVNEFVL
jgi:hypothetical protein